MVSDENRDCFFTRLASSLRSSLWSRINSLKNSHVVQDLRRTHRSINSTATSIFLSILIVGGFLPFCVNVSLIIGSILVFACTVLIILVGGIMAVLASSLVVFVPILMSVGVVTCLVYLAYSFLSKMLRRIKELKNRMAISLQVPSKSAVRFDNFNTKPKSRMEREVRLLMRPYRQTRRW